jgi:hypothetical protein
VLNRRLLTAALATACVFIAAPGLAQAQAPCVPSGGDEFDGAALDTARWSTRVRENPATYAVSGGALRITTENGDLWGGGGNAKNLILQPAPAGDWQVTTQVHIEATGGSEQAGLILHAGDDDYVKLGHIGRDGAKWFELVYEKAGQPRFEQALDRTANLPGDFPTTFQLRLTSTGGQVTGAFSTDQGASWTAVGRPADASGFADPKVGVMAITNDASEVTEGAFEWFRFGVGGAADGPGDEFDGDALHCRWSTRVRENPDAYAVSGGALRITTENGDLYGGGGDDAKNLILQPAPAGDWEVTTRVQIDATGGSEQAGLILYSGDDDYVKLGHIGRNGGKWFELVYETGAQPRFDQAQDRTANLPDGFPTTFQLRLSRTGGQVTGAYSIDQGASWTSVGRPADASGFSAPKVGVLAITNDASEVTEAAFDWFHLDAESGGDDTTAPSMTATDDGIPTSAGGYLRAATVTLAATDFGSGVESVEYAIGGGEWQPYDGPFELEGAGAHAVRYRATDVAGNTSAPGTRTVTIDAAPDCAPVTPEPGYRAVFDGTVSSLEGWQMAGPGGFDASEDCTLDAWGGMGLLWHPAEELDAPYTLRAEWRIYGDDDNSGIFIGFPDPGDDPWKPVAQGYEIQIDPTDADPTRTTGSVYGFQAPDEAARAAALRPHREWNVIEIAVDGAQITIRLNGVVINEYTSPHPERDPATGFLGIQNDGAGRDVSYRSVQITADDVDPEPEDITAPTARATLDGERNARGAYTGPVTVAFAGADDPGGSGIASIEYSIDGGAWTAYGDSFTVGEPGYHLVRFRATDAAGNVSHEIATGFSIVLPRRSGGGTTPPLPDPVVTPTPSDDPPPPAADEPASFSLRKVAKRMPLARFARRGLTVRLTTTGAMAGTARLVVARRTARRLGLKSRVVATRPVRLTAAGPLTVRLRPGRATARLLRGSKRTLTATLEVRLRGAGGKAQTITNRVALET